MKQIVKSPYIILEKYLNLVDSEISRNYIVEIFWLLSKRYTNKSITPDEIIQINSDLEVIIEDFESSIYKPNQNINFDSPQKVYNFRINLITEIINFFIL
jgi:hypothetical protein